MLPKLFTPFTLLFALAASLAHSATLDSGAKLEIELAAPGEVSIDQLHYFTQAVDQVFKAQAFAGEYSVERWSGASQTAEGPLLEFQLIRWDTWTPADFECRLYVTAIAEGRKHDLGVFAGRADAFAPTRTQQEERLVKSAAGAIEKAYQALREAGLIAPSKS